MPALMETCVRNGNYDEALRLYEQALKIKMKALGPDHADTAGTLKARDALVSAM